MDLSMCLAGSLLANLNHNNLKYGTEISRTPSFMQGAMTPLTASPNKNLGPEKMILLVCNRACSGHQGKRYLALNTSSFLMLPPVKRSRWFLVVSVNDSIGRIKYSCHEYVWRVIFQVWTAVCTVHGAHCDLGRPSERDPGENASSVEARCLHSGRKRNKPLVCSVC